MEKCSPKKQTSKKLRAENGKNFKNDRLKRKKKGALKMADQEKVIKEDTSVFVEAASENLKF